MATVIADRVTPIEILLVEDSPGDVRLTQEARRDAKVQDILHVASERIEATSLSKPGQSAVSKEKGFRLEFRKPLLLNSLIGCGGQI